MTTVRPHLTSAITMVLAKQGLAAAKKYEDIDSAPKKKKEELQLIFPIKNTKQRNDTMLTLMLRVMLITSKT